MTSTRLPLGSPLLRSSTDEASNRDSSRHHESYFRPASFSPYPGKDVGYLDYDFTWLHTLGVSAPSACRNLSLGGIGRFLRQGTAPCNEIQYFSSPIQVSDP